MAFSKSSLPALQHVTYRNNGHQITGSKSEHNKITRIENNRSACER